MGEAAAAEADGATAGDVERLRAARTRWLALGRPLDAARCELEAGRALHGALAEEALERAAAEYESLGVPSSSGRARGGCALAVRVGPQYGEFGPPPAPAGPAAAAAAATAGPAPAATRISAAACLPAAAYQPPQRSGIQAWAIVLIVLGVLAALGIGGCAVVAVLVGKTAEKAGNELDKGLRRVQNIDAITNQQADAVELGAPRSQVLDQLGCRRAWAELRLLPRRGGALGDEWQFCFAGIALTDRLTSKSRV